MIEAILPPGVVSVEAFGDDDVPGALFPAEAATLGRAVEKRRREFTTGRLCAHKALADLGVSPAPILPGKRRAPAWPAGVIGSITHCAGYRAAAVGFQRDVAVLGIDAEPHDQLPPGVLDMIALAEERAWLDDLLPSGPDQTAAGAARVWWDRLLFSAKESVYKAWYPLTNRELDFDEAVVTVDPVRCRFTARLLVPGAVLDDGRELTHFTGRWVVGDGLVVTTVALPTGADLAAAESG